MTNIHLTEALQPSGISSAMFFNSFGHVIPLCFCFLFPWDQESYNFYPLPLLVPFLHVFLRYAYMHVEHEDWHQLVFLSWIISLCYFMKEGCLLNSRLGIEVCLTGQQNLPHSLHQLLFTLLELHTCATMFNFYMGSEGQELRSPCFHS